jgi:TonB family protein
LKLQQILLLILYGLFTASAAFPQASPTTAASPGTAAAPEITIPSYSDTAQGFEKFVVKMVDLAKADDTATLAAYTKSLTLPNPDVWYKAAFGEDLGAAYATATEQARSTIGKSLPAALAGVIKDKMSRVEAHKFEQSCDSEATEKEYPLLLKRQSLIPLYDVRFWAVGSGSIWKYFAYVDRGFRYVGDLPVEKPSLPKKQDGPQEQPPIVKPLSRVRVGANVEMANVIHQVAPVYPQEAKSAHIQGTVLLRAIIDKNGHIQDLTVTQGVCWLSEAAMDAVKGWRYKPLLINGNPAEVDTTISVIFKLGR